MKMLSLVVMVMGSTLLIMGGVIVEGSVGYVLCFGGIAAFLFGYWLLSHPITLFREDELVWDGNINL
jgi:hypothetical protein